MVGILLARTKRQERRDHMWGLLGIVLGAFLMAAASLLESDMLYLIACVIMVISGYLYFKR